MAFGSFLHLQQQPQQLRQPPLQLQQQQQHVPLANYPIPRGPSVELPKQQQQQQIKRKEEITNGQAYPPNGYQVNQGMAYPFFPPPTPGPIPSEYYPQPSKPNYPPNSLQYQASVRPLYKYTMPATTATTTTTTTTATSTTSTATPTATTSIKMTTEEDNSTFVVEPQAAMLKQVGLMDAASKSAFGNDENPGQGIASLVRFVFLV